MRRCLALVTPFALALVLALGSVGFARSHGAGSAAGSIVICTGYGLVTISVDAQGKRVAEGVPCPDSIALSAALPVAAPDPAFERLTHARLGWQPARFVLPAQDGKASRHARAPPLSLV